jgi:ligand-binding SRPBCC domain-containing protein
MRELRLESEFDATPQRVFDAARDIDLHMAAMRRRGERAIAGKKSGLIAAGEEVTWRARFFGLPLRLTVRIAEFDAPNHFRDVLIAGPFSAFEHDHFFASSPVGTQMTDRLRYELPLGRLGDLAGRLLADRALRGVLDDRAAAIAEAVRQS